MENEELLKNRREVGLKLCRQIRQNNFQMINTKNFLSDRIWTERKYIDPRWYSETDIQRKNWTLKENATPELLETNSDNEYYLQKFYNATDINEVEKLETEKQMLE